MSSVTKWSRDAPIAVSAFEPFGGREHNRSLGLLRRLTRLRRINAHVLPVAFAPLPRAVAAIAARKPRRWLMLGESALATGLKLEQRAWNRIDARLPDNLGAQPRGGKVARGPLVRSTGLPIDEWVSALAAMGVAAEHSLNAGRFACNAAYYLALSALDADRVLFVHVPTDEAHGSDALLAGGLALLINHLRNFEGEAD